MRGEGGGGGLPGGYEGAIERALSGIRAADPNERAGAAGIEIVEGSGGPLFRILCLGARRLLDPRTGEVRAEGDAGGEGDHPSAKERALIARYVARAAALDPSGRWIGFREIPGGAFYWPAFCGRVGWLVARIRGGGIDLAACARRLGGGDLAMGDAGIWVPVLPRIPMAFVLWEGGEEFSPGWSILFDSTFPSHLEAEDAAVAAELLLRRLAS